jgi:streptogrisin C
MAVVLGLTAAALGAPVSSPVLTSAAAAPPLAQIQESVDYLAATYGVSTQEATRRVALDTASVGLARRLAAALPQAYAGMWLDQRAGAMVVLATDVGRAREVVQTLPHSAEIRVQAARYSQPELERMRAQAQAAAGAAGYAQVNEQANQVEVWTDRPLARAALTASGLPAAVAVRVRPHGILTACEPFDCDPPFRGGISAEMKTAPDEAGFLCTSSFNLMDNAVPPHFYATTAGHCITLASNNPQFMFHNNQVVANRAGAVIREFSGPLRDFAVMPIPNPAMWMVNPRNTVRFHCGDPSPSLCFDGLDSHRFPITAVRDYANVAVGNLVCMTGASPLRALVRPLTRCGEVTALPDSGIQTNICARRGDSGSPLFSQVTNEAFGIESQVVAPNDPLVPCANDAPHKTLYTAISRVLNIATSQLGRPITVVTAP